MEFHEDASIWLSKPGQSVLLIGVCISTRTQLLLTFILGGKPSGAWVFFVVGQ